MLQPTTSNGIDIDIVQLQDARHNSQVSGYLQDPKVGFPLYQIKLVEK